MYSISNFMIIGTNLFIFKEQSISIFFLDYFMNDLLLKLFFMRLFSNKLYTKLIKTYTETIL